MVYETQWELFPPHSLGQSFVGVLLEFCTYVGVQVLGETGGKGQTICA